MMAPRRVFGRAIAFLDGQNLYYAARRAFGYSYPNYNPVALARSLCGQQRLRLIETRFYTGVPDLGDDAFWHQFWSNKLAAMGRQGVVVYSRPLRYHEHRIKLPDGTQHAFRSAEEKGIDVRIALDVISLAYQQSYEVALIFSQDRIFRKLHVRSAWSPHSSNVGLRLPAPSRSIRSTRRPGV